MAAFSLIGCSALGPESRDYFGLPHLWINYSNLLDEQVVILCFVISFHETEYLAQTLYIFYFICLFHCLVLTNSAYHKKLLDLLLDSLVY